MQLRRYWAVVLRRWPLVALIIGLAVLGGGLLLVFGQRQFTAEVRLLLNRDPVRAGAATASNGPVPFLYDDYYRFLGTEFVLDDDVERVKGNIFARAVQEHFVAQGGPPWEVDRVRTSLKAERAHRTLTIEAITNDRELSMRLKRAVEEAVTRQPELLAPPDGSKMNIQVIHSDQWARSNWQRALLTYAIQVMLALLLALGVAFLLDYLDDRMRDEEDALALGLPLVGRLPGTTARAR